MKNKNSKIAKIGVLILFIIIMIILTIKLIPIFKNISTQQGRIELKTEIENLGSEGIFIIVSLMIVQIFLPILPGEPVEVLARYVLWPNWGNVCNFFRSVFEHYNNIFCGKKIWKKFHI